MTIENRNLVARAIDGAECLTSALIGQNGRIEEGRVSGS